MEVSENEPTVLCVNDDAEQIELLEVQLRLAHYRVIRAFDGLEAFEVAKRKRPDLVISDVAMPRADGFELCCAIRADADLSTTPILLVSAMRKDTESAVEGLRAGADDYLEAPYSAMRLVALVTRLLERKRGVDALRVSEAKYRDIFNNATMGIYQSAPDGTFLNVNPTLARLLSHDSADELINRNIADIYHDKAEREHLIKTYEPVGSGGGLEIRWKKKDGALIWVYLNARAIKDERGRTQYFDGFVHDITERKGAEEALRKSEERYRGFVEHSSEAIWRFEVDEPISVEMTEDEQIEHFYAHGYLAECNDVMARMYGFSKADEMNGVRLGDMLPRSDSKNEEFLRAFARAGYRLEDSETREVDREGRTKYFLNNLVGIIQDGKVWQVWGTQRDITERKQAEQALRDSEERYRIVAETASDAIISIDESSTILFVNRAAEKIFGYAISEMAGRKLTMLMPEYLRHLHDTGVSRYAKTGHKNISWAAVELPGLHKDGREIPLELSFGEYSREGQRVFTGVIRDITERKRTEAERQVISEIIQGVSTTRNLDELLGLMHGAISRVLHAENCYVALHNKETALLEMEFFVDKYDEACPPQKLGKSRTSHVFRTGQPLLMTEEVFRRMAESGEVEQIGTAPASWLGVPLRTPSDVIGVLVVQSYEDENAYSARDLEFLSSVGGQVALAIERKRAEGVLHETNETLRALIKDSALAIVAIDTENHVTSWNPAAERIFGWSEEEVLGRPVPTLSTDMLKKTLRLLERVYNGEHLTGYEMTRRRKDGTPVEVSISFSLLRDSDGTARGTMAVLEDITERKMMDEALKEANQRAILEYERLLERIAALAQSLGTSRDLSTVYRALKDFSLASTPCDSMFVSLYDAARGHRTAEYVWSDNTEVDPASLSPMPMNASPHSRAVATGQIVIADDLRAAVAGRHVLKVSEQSDPRPPLSALIVPMAVMGRVIGAIELQSLETAAFRQEHATAMRMAANLAAVAIENVRLLDQEHEKEEQLRQSQKMQAVGKLAGGVAHDFNNLLVAINGYSDLTLRRLKENDPLRRNLEEIKKAGERAAALTRQLLAFSRKQVMQPKVLCLNDVVLDMDKMLRRVIGEDVELTTVLDPDLGYVKADPNMLEQVVLNLAVNSRDAMPDGGRLTVETSNVLLADDYASHHAGISPGAYVMLAVCDTGTGMDAGTQERIFEPFFTTKEVGKGTGLGLSTVYGVVKQSGGNVGVSSEVGHGTAFKVYLPRVDEGTKEIVQESDADSLPIGTEKILLVEDDALVRNVAREIISLQGYTVLEAATMAEAIRHCAENSDIALLLSDVVMPQINGKELSLRLTKLLPRMRVLFMSGYSETVVHNGVLDEGLNFIQKPFTPTSLVRKLREVLDGEGDDLPREEVLSKGGAH
ncbi:MAG: PAS domain S-box protein [Rubrivivax sp.]|nr:PAS domain S-box protein [Pyrinomonadaceae bacterium]